MTDTPETDLVNETAPTETVETPAVETAVAQDEPVSEPAADVPAAPEAPVEAAEPALGDAEALNIPDSEPEPVKLMSPAYRGVAAGPADHPRHRRTEDHA